MGKGCIRALALSSCLLAVAAHANDQHWVLVTLGAPEAQASITAELKKRAGRVTSATSVWVAIQPRRSGPMPIAQLERPAPAVWPLALANDWSEAHARCRARVARQPPPDPKSRTSLAMNPAMTVPNDCAEEIAHVLWNRYLAHVGAQRVVWVERSGGAKEHFIKVDTYVPTSTEGQTARGETRKASKVPGLAVELVKAALDGEARAMMPRSTETALPSEGDGFPAALVAPPADLPTVALPATCSATPSAIEFKVNHPFFAALAERYARSAGEKATRSAAACEATALKTMVPSGIMGPMEILSVTVQCSGGKPHLVDVPTQLPVREKGPPARVLSDRLLSKLLQEFCAAR